MIKRGWKEVYIGEKKVRHPRWKSPRTVTAVSWWVSGKHSTKGMMEMMLFAAVLKLRWVSLGKSVKSTCKPLNPGSRISLGVIFRQSYKLEKVRERLEKNFDDQNTSLLEHLTISHYLCYLNWDIFLYCWIFKRHQNSYDHTPNENIHSCLLRKTVIRSHLDTAVKVVSKSRACIKFWTSGGRFRTWLDHGIDLRPPLHCTSHRLALMWGSAKFHLHFILHLHLHWQRIWLAPE